MPNYRATIPLSIQKIPNLCSIPNGLFESSKVENWMCELRTFLQIRSHIPTKLTKISAHEVLQFAGLYARC